MSYAITVEVKDGTPVVVAFSNVPDGVYNIGGHIDVHREEIEAGRRTLDGVPQARSSATVYKGV